MESARESIDLFLSQHEVAEGQQLQSAIVFVDSMLRELAVTVAEWQDMAEKLQRLKRGMASPYPN